MGKKLVFLLAYLWMLPFVILLLIVFSLYYFHTSGQNSGKTFSFLKNDVYYKALPEEGRNMAIKISPRDGRVDVLEDFFSNYNSPLVPYADKIVAEADKYGLDYRLLPAIAMQESNLCKVIPPNSYNCFGFGIYGGKVTRFEGYDEAIETVSKTMAKQYKDIGLKEPKTIMTKYTPGSNGSWANGVTYFMESIGKAL